MTIHSLQQFDELIVVTHLGLSDLRTGYGLMNGFSDHLHTPLETTLYNSLTHTD
jgi:hypothetical protein